MTVEDNRNDLLLRLAEAERFRSAKTDDLTPAERVFRCVWDLEAEVGSGGFDQYYSGEAGGDASAAVHALKAIGAHRTAKIVQEANRVLGEGELPGDAKQRVQVLDELDDPGLATLDRLDRDFYAHPDDLLDLLYEYVRRHKVDIEGAVHLGI